MSEIIKKKYNVAYLTHGARNVGGGEYILYFLIKNLRRDIFEPIIFYSQENVIISRLKEEGVRLIKISLSKKLTSVYRDEIKKNPRELFLYFRYMISGIFKVRKLVKKYQIDILHPHDNLSKIISGLAALLTRSKVVAHCHDLLEESFLEKMLMFYQLLFCDRIIAVSESVKTLFSIFGKIPSKVHTIHNGIDINKFTNRIKRNFKESLKLNKKDIVIGIIAVFDKCKGHIYLFKAIQRLILNGINNIVCLVIGDGREQNELLGYIKKEGLEKHFLFLGYRNDVPELLSIIDIIAIPSLKESFGMVALEAMAMRVPVVTTKVGGLLEIIEEGKTGMFVPPANIDELFEALKYLIQNRVLRNKMGKAGKKRVTEKFTLESNVRQTEELYLDILKPR